MHVRHNGRPDRNRIAHAGSASSERVSAQTVVHHMLSSLCDASGGGAPAPNMPLKAEPMDAWPPTHFDAAHLAATEGTTPPHSFPPAHDGLGVGAAPMLADGFSRCASAIELGLDAPHGAVPPPGVEAMPPLATSKPKRASAGATLQALAHAADSNSDDAGGAPAPKRSQRSKRTSKASSRLSSPTAPAGRARCAALHRGSGT